MLLTGATRLLAATITESSALISLGSQNGCSIPVTSAGTMGTATISIPYASSGGHTLTSSLSIDVGAASSIVFNAPTGLKVGTNRTQTIDALDYATDGGYTITCGTATNTAANVPTSGTVALTSVVRDASGNGCGYTITPTATQGTATFTIPYTSAGGDTANGNISITVGPASTISYSTPGTLRVGRNQTLEIDASGYVSDNSAYTITCADATGVVATRMAVTRTANSCTFTIDPVDALTPANQGVTTFSVVFTSDGGHSITRTISVNIGPDSTVTFTDPGTFTLGRNRTLVIDALAATSGENAAYTVTCADATGVDANKMTVTRSSSGDGCSFTVDPVNTLAVGSQGDTTFTVAYTSTGGATATGTFTVNIGPDSTITFMAPPTTGANRLLIGRNKTLEIDASDYATEASPSNYAISCSDARGLTLPNRIASVTRTAGTCRFTINPNTFAFPGTASFTITYTSTGGDSVDGTITVNVGPNSAIIFTAPPTTGANRLLTGRNQALVVDASAYASETSGSDYTITCGDATSIDTTRLASVTHTGSSCSFTVTPISTLSSTLQATAATFTVPYTSSGGDTENGVISVKIGPDSNLTFTAPSTFNLARNRTLVIDASAAVTGEDSTYAISCGDATGVDANKMTVSHTGSSCSFTVDPVNNLASGSQGDTTFSVAFTSTGGATASGTFTVNIGPDSTITYSTPGTLTVGRNRTLTIDASSYVEEATGSSYTISCSDAAGVDNTRLTSVTRTANTCSFTITPVTTLTPAQQGDTTFTITFTSTGGHEITRTITVDVGPDSTIVFTQPASNLAIAANRTRTIDVSSYAVDGSYTISCGAITESSALISLGSQDGCNIPVTSVGTQGTATISIPYTSSGGHTTTGTLTLDVGAASSIDFTAPTGLKVGVNRTQTIDASDYASDGGYTITCGTATNTAAHVPTSGTVALSVTRPDPVANSCIYTITPTPAQGTAIFTIPYTSSGGDTSNENISITVGPPSIIRGRALAPSSRLRVARNQTLEIDASSYVYENSAYTITCGDATRVDATRMSVTRTANTCTFTIDPVDTLAPANQGSTTFIIPFTSDGGHSINLATTVNIGPDSSVTFTAPSTFTLGRNRTLEIDALAAISGENAAYTVSCADATGVDATKMTVTRSSSGDGCSFTVDPLDTLAVGSQGDTTFSVAYTSTGGATASGTFTVNIGPDSTITYTAPTGLLIGRNLTLEIDASDYVTEASPSNYTISCSDARSVHSRLTSVARTANTCSYTIDPNNFAFPFYFTSPRAATFVVTFTSTGGHSIDRTITVNVGPDSNIVFTAPTGLTVGRNRSLAFDALSYVTENPAYTVTCGDATAVDVPNFTGVARSTLGNGCTFTATPNSALPPAQQGNATFTVPLTSTGGATRDVEFTVNIGPDSTITYNAPSLERGSNLRTFTIDASDYVSEISGSGYTISCGAPTGVDTTEITSVTRLSNSCRYRIVLNGTQGTTGFTVPYTSTGGHAISRAVQISVGAASAIVFSAPASNPAVAASRTLTLNVGSYATDGSYTISCGTIREFSALISLGSQTGCSVPITAATSTGTAFISVPYVSSGGATTTRSISIDVGVASDIQFSAPSDLKVGINRTQTINALDYASDSGYTITCGTATSVDSTKLTSVVRDSSGNGCGYTITPISTLTQSQQGSASFTVPLTSDGGDSENAVFSIAVGPTSTITFTPPSPALSVAKNRTITVDVSGYAVEANPTNYAISCGDATSIDTVELQSVTHTGSSCTFTINPKNVTGSASFTVPYTSEGGHSVSGAISVTVGPDSNIVYTAPTGLRVGRNRTLVIDATDHFTEDSTYTVTCGDATGIDSTRLTSVARTANTCTFTVDPVDTLAAGSQGNTTFSVPLSSTGGDSKPAVFTVNVGPDSNIVFAAPTGLKVGRNRTLEINALAAVTENGVYTVTCAEAAWWGVDANRMTVTRTSTGTGCVFTVDPVNNIPTGSQGNTTFAVAFTSTGGATATGIFTVNIGPDSTISYNAPTGLLVGRNRTLTIDASGYVTESDSNNTISCGDATAIHSRLTRVTRDNSGNGCSYTIDPNNFATPGTATFSIAFTSDGGHSRTETISVEIGPDSNIRFTAPPTSGPNRLRVGRNLTLSIDALDYVNENAAYTVTCGDATGVSSTRLTVTHTGSSCDFTIDPIDTLATSLQGNTSFTIPYTSDGGGDRHRPDHCQYRPRQLYHLHVAHRVEDSPQLHAGD